MVLALAGLSTMTTFIKSLAFRGRSARTLTKRREGGGGPSPMSTGVANSVRLAAGSRGDDQAAGEQFGPSGERELDQGGEDGGRRRRGRAHDLVARHRGGREQDRDPFGQAGVRRGGRR